MRSKRVQPVIKTQSPREGDQPQEETKEPVRRFDPRRVPLPYAARRQFDLPFGR